VGRYLVGAQAPGAQPPEARDDEEHRVARDALPRWGHRRLGGGPAPRVGTTPAWCAGRVGGFPPKTC